MSTWKALHHALSPIGAQLESSWGRLLPLARRHPVLSVAAVFVLLLAVAGFGGPWIQPFADRLDNSAKLGGLLSLCLGWALALVLWLRRREGRRNVIRGEAIDNPAGLYDASVVLGGRNCQPEWHLRHVRPEHVEFVWTAFTSDATKDLLDLFPEIRCAQGPDNHRAHVGELERPYDFQAVKDHTLALIRTLKASVPAERICVDVTAGTAVMSIGAFQAAMEEGVSPVYLLGTDKDRNGMPKIDETRVDDVNAATMHRLWTPPIKKTSDAE